MKKCFPIILIVSVLILVLQVVANIFITERDAEYVLMTDDNEYIITEKLRVVDDVSYYDFTLLDSEEVFYTFSYIGDFNKQTEVVEDMVQFKSNDLSCILPIYKKEKYGDIACRYADEQVSYSYLKQINNADVKVITDKLKTLGYEDSEWDRVETETTRLELGARGIDVYKNNILKDYTFLIWRYSGLYILKEEKSLIKEYLTKDQYDNKYSALVGRYYVTAKPKSETNKLSELIYYNTKEMGKGTIYLLEESSADYYFNGVFDGKLYMTDVGLGKQYSIDPASEKVEVVGTSKTSFVTVDNGKLLDIATNEFLNKKVYFTDYVRNKDIENKYGKDVQIKKERSFFYFKTADGSVYKSHEDSPANAVLLFKFDNLTEWNEKYGDILAVAGDMVYFYSNEDGLLPIAKNSELLYNHTNICDFWKEN